MNHAKFVAENFGDNDSNQLKKIYHNINENLETNDDFSLERKYQRINSHEQKTTVENH